MHIIDKNRERLVLLVEDDPADQELARRALAQVFDSCVLKVVEDGEEALDYLLRRGRHAEARRPDLILLDLNLPRLNGLQVLEQLRGRHGMAAIPVLALTTSRLPEYVEETYRLGASAFICKPATFDGYRAVMKSIGDFWFHTVLLPERS